MMQSATDMDVTTSIVQAPTVQEAGNKGTIIRRNNHIAIDCGCVYGHFLAAYCMETEEEFYIAFEGKPEQPGTEENH